MDGMSNRFEIAFGHSARQSIDVKKTPRTIGFDFQLVFRKIIGPLNQHAARAAWGDEHISKRIGGASRGENANEFLRHIQHFVVKGVGVVTVPIRSEVLHQFQLLDWRSHHDTSHASLDSFSFYQATVPQSLVLLPQFREDAEVFERRRVLSPGAAGGDVAQ